VLDDFGGLGRAYRETDEAEADTASVIDNLLRGEYSHPVRVIAFNTDKDYARDVSHEIALAVIERARKEKLELRRARGISSKGSERGRIAATAAMIKREVSQWPRRQNERTPFRRSYCALNAKLKCAWSGYGPVHQIETQRAINRHRGRPFGSHPCHTTRHAGPHRAVREVEVMRDGAVPAGPTSSGSTRR
jgi:hypothetical protein